MIGWHAGKSPAMDRLELPCGRCVGCRLDRARSWSIRAMHEAQCWDSNLFVTLTYAPDKLESWSLEYRDFQLFMKKLRKEFRGVTLQADGKAPIRFFCAGEYGGEGGRPHFHALLFNADFPDKVRFHDGSFRSAALEALWPVGRAHIGSVTPQSAAYVAGYTLGKAYGAAAFEAYEDVLDTETGELTSRRPEFCCMSRRPGIGALWYKRFGRDVLPNDFAVSADGKRYKVPRYYWQRFREDPANAWLVERVEDGRIARARAVDPDESSDRRRRDRAEVARRRVEEYKRHK